MNKVTISTGDLRSSLGVWMYSAPDLQNNCWTLIGQILPNSPSFSGLVRPSMIYNAANNNWVIWARVYDILNANVTAAGVATCTTVTGPCSWVNSNLNVDNNTPGDMTLFLDTDGNGYVLYHDNVHQNAVISQLNSTFTNTNGNSVNAITGAREGFALIKQASTYFLISAGLGGYNSQGHTFGISYATSTAANPLSGWSGTSSIWGGLGIPGANTPYNGQASWGIQPNGKTQSIIIGADWWFHNDLASSSQVWIPVTFPTSTTMQATRPSTWDLSTLN